MDDIEKNDVEEIVNPAEGGEEVENRAPEGDDKDKNFAALRKQLKEREEEIERLKSGTSPEGERSLGEERKSDPLFERDLKDATYEWNKNHKISKDDWDSIKSKVSLKGDETRSQILDKIDEAYSNLPSVRQIKEKELIEKGKQEALRQMNDNELDIGSGGDVDFGGDPAPKINKKTRDFARAMGMKDEDIKKVDMSANPNEWKILDNR